MTDGEKEIRKEFNRPSFKEKLEKVKGKRCQNCGSEENIQYHHIVPICVGGTNSLDNIVPLCQKCHTAIHFSKHVREQRLKSARSGRKSAADTDAGRKAIDDYIHCRIGSSEFKRIMHYGEKTKVQDCHALKRRLKELGIMRMSNMVDYNAYAYGELASEHNPGGYILEDGRMIDGITGKERYVEGFDRETVLMLLGKKGQTDG